MDTIQFAELATEHLPVVLDIYNHYVLHTTATFHSHVLSMNEMKDLVIFESPVYKTFVIFQDESLCGYVLLTQFKKREAYDGTAEVTIYLKSDFTGKGIGNLALDFIESYASTKELHVLLATICGENAASVKLFEKCGYTRCARYKEVGKKFGKSLDVVVYQKIIDC
ncbi:MAG: N-acetyltransferase [Coriobacteriia bacterium]|nr:N-acetyltransferase [Coriobacteriia bacterium]